MKVSPFAGKPARPSMLVNVPKLVAAYYTEVPDPGGSGMVASISALSRGAIIRAISATRPGMLLVCPVSVALSATPITLEAELRR